MLRRLEEFAKANHVPIIRKDAAEFLKDFCIRHQPRKILEIGTAIGYSGLIMLEASKNASLVTLEIDAERQNIAKEALKGRDVMFFLEDAGSFLERLSAVDKFDLIFLDGPKSQYIKYLPHLLRVLNTSGHILADNVLFNGWVEGDSYPKHKHRTHIVNLRNFLSAVSENPSLDIQLYRFADGMAVIKWK